MKTFLDTLQFSNSQFSFSTSLNDFSSVGFKTEIYTFLLSFNSNKPKELYKNEYISLSLTLGFVRLLALETFSFHCLGSFIAFKVLFLCLPSLHSASRFEFKYFQNNDEVWDLSKSLFFFFIKWWSVLAGD